MNLATQSKESFQNKGRRHIKIGMHLYFSLISPLQPQVGWIGLAGSFVGLVFTWFFSVHPVKQNSAQPSTRLENHLSRQSLPTILCSCKDQIHKHMKVSINMQKITSGIIAAFVFVLCIAQPSSAADLRVIKISPQDQRAVVRIDKGDLQVIEVGDELEDFGRVIQIAPGRIVLETEADNGTELVIIRLKNGQHNIERIRKGGEEATVLQAPQSNRQQ
jgi:hypothetical protein